FQVTHFTDQDDVRVFTQSRTQGFGEAQGVAVHFALVDQALLRFVNEFDRVLDGEDVLVLGVVQVVEHGREGRGLARAGGAGNQYQAARHVGDPAEDLTHAEVFHGQHLGRNGPEHRTATAVLVEGVYPEARHTRHFKREVGLEKFFEILALLVVHDVVDQRMHLLVVHGRQIDAAYIAINANHRRQTGRKVQIRCTLLGAEGQQF